MNFGVFKEPRGLVKILQFVLAIFAFATTCGVFTSSSFMIGCKEPAFGPIVKNHTYEIKIWYPFNLAMDENSIPNVCSNTTKTGASYPSGNYQNASQFYVFIGVMAWLYSIGGLVLYVAFHDNWESNDKIRIGDFVTTCVFVVMWLIASSAWADGLSGLKHYSDPKVVLTNVYDCQHTASAQCFSKNVGDFATLNVSLIFGFGNMVLFAASLWFLWKETPWHRANEESFTPQHEAPPENMPPQDTMPPSSDAQY